MLVCSVGKFNIPQYIALRNLHCFVCSRKIKKPPRGMLIFPPIRINFRP